MVGVVGVGVAVEAAEGGAGNGTRTTRLAAATNPEGSLS